jgi:hypothetical protein
VTGFFFRPHIPTTANTIIEKFSAHNFTFGAHKLVLLSNGVIVPKPLMYILLLLDPSPQNTILTKGHLYFSGPGEKPKSYL